MQATATLVMDTPGRNRGGHRSAPRPLASGPRLLAVPDRKRTAGGGRIGRYEILDVLGHGGFAVVYQGFDPLLKRAVAIKVCSRRDPKWRQRFRREAEIGGLLNHPSIPVTYDFGFDGDTPYLVQEYLPRQDLSDRIARREPYTLEHKLEMLIQIASGLGHAHSRDILHRDVKPANGRVLEGCRQVKIVDFGSARRSRGESRLTEVGTVVGTVAYLSPECLLGKPADERSDVFSFGVLAYELLSFRRPFDGRDLPCLVGQMLDQTLRPLAESWAGCPADVARIVERCLGREPGDRYPSFAVVEADLRSAGHLMTVRRSTGKPLRASSSNVRRRPGVSDSCSTGTKPRAA